MVRTEKKKKKRGRRKHKEKLHNKYQIIVLQFEECQHSENFISFFLPTSSDTSLCRMYTGRGQVRLRRIASERENESSRRMEGVRRCGAARGQFREDVMGVKGGGAFLSARRHVTCHSTSHGGEGSKVTGGSYWFR